MANGTGRDADAGDDRARRVPTTEVDHLTEDPPVVGQAFACVSFVSPTDVLPRRDAFFFQAFLAEVFRPKIEAFADAAVSSPASARTFADALVNDLEDIGTDFDAFVGRESARLDDAFAAENPLQLTTQGFKVRGCCPDLDTAKSRAEALRREDPTTDVFVAQVGAWCPFNPSPESIGDVVYDETELNTLMKLRKEADASRLKAFTETTKTRIEETRREGAAGANRDTAADDDDAAASASASASGP